MSKPSQFPPLWCDFNACGLSRRPDDDCYYALHPEEVKAFAVGDRVFLYDDDVVDGAPGVVGIEAQLVDYRGTLIARPTGEAFYHGPRFW
jgi:hypothetical protein